MDRSKLLKIISIATAAFFLAIAVLLLVLGITLDLKAFPRVVLILMGVCSLALAGEVGYFALLTMNSSKPNYFLYDVHSKRNVSVQKLTFQMVNSRMNRYLSEYAASEGKIWNERVLDNPYIKMEDDFKPLVAYKLLFSLAENDSEAGWRCLENSSEETVKFICNGLAANGETEFSSTIEGLMASRPADIKQVRDYLVRNKKYMQSKMMKYVRDNIDRF